MPELRLVVEPPRDRLDVITTWLPRIAVALFFLSVGVEKFSSDGPWVKVFAQIGFGQGLRYVTGTMQVGGALLVLIPRTTLAGVSVLACTMLGAVLVHLFILHSVGNAVIPAALLAILVVVGFRGRRTGTI